MTAPFTLSRYIARRFCYAVAIMTVFLVAIICTFDLLDLLRRIANKTSTPSDLAFHITALHIPYFILEILPFAILPGGLLCFWYLSRSSELIAARAAGISAWQFLSLAFITSIIMGLLAICLLSPISAQMYHSAETLDQKYIRSSGNGTLNLSNGVIWFQQPDYQFDMHGQAMIHAHDIHIVHGQMHFHDVHVFRLDHNGQMIVRIESPDGYLTQKAWVFNDASSIKPNTSLHPIGTLSLPTDLSLEELQNNFASPESFSLWSLPSFIPQLEKTGFSSMRHKIRYQSLLALPAFCGTMMLIAAGFSTRSHKQSHVISMIGLGIAAGFLLFSIAKVAQQFGRSGNLPPFLAAWAPIIAGFLLATALLLHLEDG